MTSLCNDVHMLTMIIVGIKEKIYYASKSSKRSCLRQEKYSDAELVSCQTSIMVLFSEKKHSTAESR